MSLAHSLEVSAAAMALRHVSRPAGDVALPPLRAKRLLDQVRERARGLHFSLRTQKAYVYWCRASVRFHALRHPAEMDGPEVGVFLTLLAAERGLSVSSHRPALLALLFLYGKVLRQQRPWIAEIGRPVPSRRLAVVTSPQEVCAVLQRREGVHGLRARVLRGTGMRIEEVLQLRVKGLDFANRSSCCAPARQGRTVMLPRSLTPALRRHVWEKSRVLWSVDAGARGCWCPAETEPGGGLTCGILQQQGGRAIAMDTMGGILRLRAPVQAHHARRDSSMDPRTCTDSAT